VVPTAAAPASAAQATVQPALLTTAVIAGGVSPAAANSTVFCRPVALRVGPQAPTEDGNGSGRVARTEQQPQAREAQAEVLSKRHAERRQACCKAETRDLTGQADGDDMPARAERRRHGAAPWSFRDR
jgi:hypothetical protein